MLVFFNNLTVWWTAVATFAALLWLWWRRPCPNFPPGPRGLPIVGVLFYLIKNPQITLRKWSLKYGPVSSARLGRSEVVFLNTFDSFHEALVKKASVFGGRAKLDIFSSVLGNNGLIGRRTDREYKVQRTFLMQTLRHYGMGKKEMENIINEESQHFVEHLQTKIDKPFSLHDETYKFFANVIMKIVTGERHQYDEKMFRSLCETLNNQFHSPLQANFLFIMTYYYDLLKYIPPFSFAKSTFEHGEKIFSGRFRPIIEHHRKTLDPKSCRDYIDSYIVEQKNGRQEEEPSFSDRNLEAIIRDLFEGGTDTGCTTLAWMILCLLHHPNYYQIIQDEIDTNIAKSQSPTIKSIKGLPMLCAFIEEVLRRFPMGPNSLPHVTLEDTTLCGYNIPKGTRVAPNIYSVHLDPNTWPDPEKFDPNRHMDENGKFVSSGKVVTFSLGTRSCPGEALARMEAPLILVKLLQYYTIEPCPGRLPSLDDGIKSFFFTPKRYDVVLKPR